MSLLLPMQLDPQNTGLVNSGTVWPEKPLLHHGPKLAQAHIRRPAASPWCPADRPQAEHRYSVAPRCSLVQAQRQTEGVESLAAELAASRDRPHSAATHHAWCPCKSVIAARRLAVSASRLDRVEHRQTGRPKWTAGRAEPVL